MNIKQFYNPRDHRSYCSAPFNHNGRTIALDGIVLISTPLDPAYAGNTPFTPPTLDGILSAIDAAEFSPIPPIIMPITIPCSHCLGSKKSTITTCPECDGDGEVDTETDYNTYTSTCKTCDGDGEQIIPYNGDDCIKCHGTGYAYNHRDTIEIGGVQIAAPLLAKIIDADGLEVAPIKEKGMLIFRAGENTGVLMGCRPQS